MKFLATPVLLCFFILSISAQNCPPTKVIIEPLLDSCLVRNGINSIQLNAQVFDDPTNGVGISNWTGGSYISADGLFTPDVQGAYPINFSYTSNGCTFDTFLTINMYETPIIDFELDALICEAESANISFIGSAHPDAIFDWNFDGGTISGTNRLPRTIHWNDNNGAKNVSLNIDNSGCLGIPVSKLIEVDPVLDTIDIFCDQTATTTTSVGFAWNVDDNVDLYEIEIKRPGGVRQPRQSQTRTDFLEDNLPSNSNNQGVTIYVSTISETECGERTDSMFCPLRSCPGVELVFERIPTLCVDDDPIEINVTRNGGNNTGTVRLSGPGYVNGFFNPGIRGAGSFWIVGEMEERGCTYIDSVEIIVRDLPTVTAAIDQALDCATETVEISSLNSSSNIQYEWFYDGSSVGIGRTIEVGVGGLYTLVGTDGITGCSNTDEIFVDAQFSNPSIDLQMDEISCFGKNDGVITVTGMNNGVPPFEYSFNGSSFSEYNVFFDNLGEGAYKIVGRDANGCTTENNLFLREPDPLTVEIIVNTGENPMPLGDSIQLEALINYAPDLLTTIEWISEEEMPICDSNNMDDCLRKWVAPRSQTVYSVQVESLNGCFSSDDFTVVTSRDFPVYVPSAFSPSNQDGTNDWFQVYAKKSQIRLVKSFFVFNRNGELMFENKNYEPALGIDPANAWDGKFKGKRVTTGNYVYFAEIEFVDGAVEVIEGDVLVY